MAASDEDFCRKESLISQPWRPFFINNKHFLVKSYFSNLSNAYEICISDFNKIWLEVSDQDTIKTRNKELNPNIEADVTYIVKHIKKNVEEQQQLTKYQMQENENDEKLVLHFKTTLQPGVMFTWDFHCSTEEQMISSSLLEPLVDMVAELQRRQTELQNLLEKKDLEISDYKASGVKLSHKRFETKTFDREAFNNKMVLSSGFGETVAKSKTLGFTEGLQELYKQVVIKRAWLQEKRLRETEVSEDSLLETAIGSGVPSSLFSDTASPNVSPQISPRKTPVPSPQKSSTENSPSKDRELQRREELRRKLEEEEERKKRKKKKIKL
ncbi:non-homologous end-joining factor 1-like isoform X1 [Actinia tenebrosa]|uniref:Non-homologous end-joining factor 1 n=1 Tax=Actinia tenebrosa TaxID=6105 RepID=A0A6P8HW40_ACTTE|nr:non-homologous end-joining factor 1-like isoform X1 [Actinia tenebrosa]